jgi:dTDP-4-dehydrorhamnose reductase
VRQAAASGWAVRATWWQRPPDAAAGVDWRRLDVRDAGAVRAAIAGVDAVVHTAYRQHDDPWGVNVDGSAAVATAAAGRRLVHLSTDLVFDGTRGRYREDDELRPLGAYGASKAEAERRVGALHARATIARTSLLYGGPEPGPQERLALEGRAFFTDELRSPVHVGDLAAALLELLELELPGPIHLGGATDVSRFDFAVLLGADADAAERAQAPPERARDVTLDSSRAQASLRTPLRGVYEVLGGL